MAPSFGNFWRRGWRMTNGLACRPITKLSAAARVPLSVAWAFLGAQGHHPHPHPHLRRRKQSLSCPSTTCQGLHAVDRRTERHVPRLRLRQARPVSRRVFLRGIRSTMQVNVDLCDDVMFFVSEMLQNNYSACRTRRWHSGHDSLNLVLNRGTYTAAGFSIKCFPLSHDQPRRAFLLSIMPQVPL